jgi:hypothetical protein
MKSTVSLLPGAAMERIKQALAIARGGLTDGAHHKQWVIDQMVRALLGNDEAAYRQWVAAVERDKEYVWDTGIPS